ncbi:MAG TPA: NAD(P)/FAD-dependent oxidoreductase [Terriglobales bacterium]|jgi:flavin-dependent dehydrogenase
MLTANHKTFDLAVVGAGPAGASSGITAARLGANVVLFEAKSFPRHKVCGEFVSAESLDVLVELFRDSESGRRLVDSAGVLRRARLFLGGRTIDAPVSPPAVSITRYDLDAALWESARLAGVEARSNCEVTSITGDGPFQLTTAAGSYFARALVIAAGRWSQFAADRVVPPGPKWIGVKGHFRESDPSPSTDLYFFEEGYCGVQPVSASTVNACAMVRSDRATSLPEAFALHPRLAERSASWEAGMSPVSTAPLIYRQPRPAQGNILYAGDAAAFIDPFVGDGISIALRSGKTAAECLRFLFSGESALAECASRYQREYARQFAPLLSAASRVRTLLSLPVVARAAVFELFRIPGLMPLVIRKTRRVS